MARVSAPTLLELARARLTREHVDERTRWFGARVIELLAVDLTVIGADRVPRGRAVVYMANHQSHQDIPICYASLPSPTVRMLAKTELFKIPLWGRGLGAADFVEVDLSNHAKAVASIEEAKRLLRDGVSIWLAPEGTRSRDGRIGKLKKGGFHLAIETGTPIVPVAIDGTIGILPRGARVMKSGQPVTVTIGAPIAVTGRAPSSELIDGLMAEVSEFLVANVEGKVG